MASPFPQANVGCSLRHLLSSSLNPETLLSSNHYSVAVFDVVTLAGQSAPIILHQPRPTLHTLFPGQQFAKELARLDERTYVGIIGDSLFAMSHVSYPLVRVDYRFPHPSADDYGSEPSSSNTDVDLPLVERECTAHGCLVGNHLSRVDSASSRFSRLIEARPPKLLIEGPPLSSSLPSAIGGISSPRDPFSRPSGEGYYSSGFWSTYWAQASILSTSLGLGFIALIARRRGTSNSFISTAETLSNPTTSISEILSEGTQESTPALTSTLDEQPPTAVGKPKTTVAFVESSKPIEDEAGADDSEGDGDEGAESEELKRKKRRRRGRKKGKSDVPAAASGDEPLHLDQLAPLDERSNPNNKDNDFVFVAPAATNDSPLPLPPTIPVSLSPSLPPSTSLSVSDVVLG